MAAGPTELSPPVGSCPILREVPGVGAALVPPGCPATGWGGGMGPAVPREPPAQGEHPHACSLTSIRNVKGGNDILGTTTCCGR